jgi:transcriptional regulator with PAS, ATPase and Fis domain
MARLAACVIAACLAVALIETFSRDGWDILALALVPLYFACRLYGMILLRRDSERCHRDVLQSLDQALAIVDTSGRVTLWNDALARLEREVIARGVFTSVQDLARKLMRYICAYSKNARPFKWKYADVRRRILPC